MYLYSVTAGGIAPNRREDVCHRWRLTDVSASTGRRPAAATFFDPLCIQSPACAIRGNTRVHADHGAKLERSVVIGLALEAERAKLSQGPGKWVNVGSMLHAGTN